MPIHKNTDQYNNYLSMQDEGLYEGSHAEGALLNSILTLLFWDIIYHSEVQPFFLI